MKYSIEPTVENKKPVTEEVYDYTSLAAVFDMLEPASYETCVKALNWYFSSKELADIHEYLKKELDIDQLEECGKKATTVDDKEELTEAVPVKAIATGILYAVDNWDTLKDIIETIKTTSSEVYDKVVTIVEYLRNKGQSPQEVAQEVGDIILNESKHIKEAKDSKLGKKVKQLKGWKIYQGTTEDGEETFRCFTPDDDRPTVGWEDWEIETLEQAISWVENYDNSVDESKTVSEGIDTTSLLSKVSDSDLKNLVKSAGVKLSGSESKDEVLGMAKMLTANESFVRRVNKVAKLESSKLKRKKGIPHVKVEESKKISSKFLK